MLYLKVEVTLFDTAGDALRLWVRLRYRLQAYPRTYFYLSFPDLPIRHSFQSYLVPVAFWNPVSRDCITEFSFLIHEEPSASLKQYFQQHQTLRIRLIWPPITTRQLRSGNSRHKWQRYCRSVLPFVLSILSRNKQDKEDKDRGAKSSLYCDKVRKVDLIWKLDCNSQVERATSYFAALSEMEIDVGTGSKKKISRVRLLNRARGPQKTDLRKLTVTPHGLDLIPIVFRSQS